MSESDSDEIDIAAQLANVQDESSGSDDDEGDLDLSSLTRAANIAQSRDVVKALSKHAGGNKQAREGKLTGGGSFQSMGLPANLVKALLQRGFSTPTPIQRAALPSILGETSNIDLGEGKKLTVARDHVCMARTGSGKTLCYLLPMLARLAPKGHAPTYGARALVLVPTRELALQVLRVGKDLARAFKNDDATALRWAVLVGGESLDDQFGLLAANPDVIIATPGRLLHLVTEMSLSLSRASYLVLDEADRLFSLGFEQQLHALLPLLPSVGARQTLLFSATLPSSLVGFAKIGLQHPKLVRLDAEAKISKDLRMAFLLTGEGEKEALLTGLLRDVIGVKELSGDEERERETFERERENAPPPSSKKRRRGDGGGDRRVKHLGRRDSPQAVIFVATKHHVEYLTLLLTHARYPVSSIYGSMDQVARTQALNAFRHGTTSLLVVTDLAARGLDVPGVENVVNYDFPNGSRAFVHRVGRTARAGRSGWAWTFVERGLELARLVDLELFLGRPVTVGPFVEGEIDYTDQLVLGRAPRSLIDVELDAFRAALAHASQLDTLQEVARRGRRLYERGLSKVGKESIRRAKVLDDKLREVDIGNDAVVPATMTDSALASSAGVVASTSRAAHDDEARRAELMKKIQGFTPQETVFELGVRGKQNKLAGLMHSRRVAMHKSVKARQEDKERQAALEADEQGGGEVVDSDDELAEEDVGFDEEQELSQADDSELEDVFGSKRKKQKTAATGKSYRDPQFYMGYEQEGANTEKGYSLADGESFAAQAANATFDLETAGDTEGIAMEARAQKASQMRWDRKSKKFIRGDGTGSDNKKLIRSESGAKLPASFKSGAFDDWKKKSRVYVPRVGERELSSTSKGGRWSGEDRRFKHKGNKAAEGMDAGESRSVPGEFKGKKRSKGIGSRTVGKPTGKASDKTAGIKSAAQIRKDRADKAKRVWRSSGPGKKTKKN